MFWWEYKTNLEGVPRDPKFRGGTAGSSISVDLFQHGNEADELLCIFTWVSPANVKSNFDRNVLMGMQKKFRRGTTWSDIPGGGVACNSITEELFQHGNELDISLCTFTCVSSANDRSNFSRNVLMGMQNKLKRGATWSNIPEGWHAIQFGLFSAWKGGIMYLYMRLSRKCKSKVV